MALLLIDNYDSYTYNLFQLLAEATGRPPLTVRNDAFSSWEDLCASLPEPPAGVVISPGPGSPELPGDFGVCAAAYHAGLPLLGVCLGHQGLALAFGGAVHRAREVMHGRISTVHHDGEGLFAAVPEPFEAPRVEAANGGGKKSGKKSGAAAHGSRAEADEWLRETGDAVVRLSKMNLSGKSRVMPSGSGAPSKSEAPRQEAREAPSTAVTASTAGFTSARSESGYMEDVETIFEWLRSGDTYEVCLTTQLHAPAPAPSPLVLYRTLRRLNPAPYAAFLHVDLERLGASSNAAEASQSAFSVCCSSPERFLRVEPSGLVQAKPIKGTAPREACAVADEMSARALRNSEKDCAENLMIVDLIRHDLGRVCRVGSVFVEQLMAIESFATVHQLVSTVSGELEPPLDALDAAAAAFPPGSMTGAPKSRTLRIIDQLEQRKPRGIYSGTLGYFSIDGAADLNVVIRTAITNQDGTWVGTGGAVVALSEPLDEWHEAMLKAQAVLQACQACNKGDAAAR